MRERQAANRRNGTRWSVALALGLRQGEALGLRWQHVDLDAATLLLAQGVDQRVVMEILGHSQISMTSKYAHVLPEVMTEAADCIGQALWGDPSGPTATRTATGDPPRSHDRGISAGHGCAARDLNPEPAD